MFKWQTNFYPCDEKMIAPKNLEAKRKKLKAEQWRKLKKLLKIVLATNKFYQRKYAKVGVKSADDIKTLEDFYNLPFTTREEMIKDQEENPPFGTNFTSPPEKYFFLHSTSGTTSNRPFYTFETVEDLDQAAEGQALRLRMMGVKRHDLILLATLAVSYLQDSLAAKKAGALLVPAAENSPEELLQRLIELPITVLYASPTTMLRLIEVAKEQKIDLSRISRLKRIISCGEILVPSVRQTIGKSFKVDCYNSMGTSELKALCAECFQKDGPHLLEEYTFFEVRDAEKNKTNASELVATSLWRRDFPMIRYRTGDLVEIDWRSCPCGSLSPRIKGGVVRRVGSRLKFRNMFLYPDEIEEIIRKFWRSGEYLIELEKIEGMDEMEIRIEMPFSEEPKVIPKLTEELGKRFGLYPHKIISVAPGTFPRAGWKSKRIVDNRLGDKGEAFLDTRLKEPFFWQNLGRRLIRKIFYTFFKQG